MATGYELIGSGLSKVMVLHGIFGDHGIWSPTYPLLDREQFTYAFMDCRGYGASRAMAGNHTMREISADAIALADGLGWEKFSVVGHSMGGMAAQRVAVDAGQRIQCVVGVTPVPASGVPFPPEVRARMVQPRDCGDLIRYIANLPKHVVMNEVHLAPTHNRGYVANLQRKL